MLAVKADLHVHTYISLCAARDALAVPYISSALSQGISTVCFTDHFWDEAVPGASGWYKKQDTAHIAAIDEELATITAAGDYTGVRVLRGVETEFVGSRMCGKKGGTAGITPRTAEGFDFVLIPPDHFHMKGFTIPADVADPAALRGWYVDNFIEAASGETGVPHPFLPMGFDRLAPEDILRAISDDDFRRCFAVAAEKGRSVEFNRSLLPQKSAHDEYRRMFAIAKSEGCRFHFGSDAHSHADFADHTPIAAFAESCGIRESDIFTL